MLWLIVASLVFYGFWSPIYLSILLASILVNYLVSVRIAAASSELKRRSFLAAGILFNLGLLGYFKYTQFLGDIFTSLTDRPFTIQAVLFPIGISFYTFQQIAYLVDRYRQEPAQAHSLLSYLSFTTFFPTLISGPLLRFHQLQPQWKQLPHRLTLENLTVGLMLFAIGLGKKLVLADGIAPYANQVFAAAATEPLTWMEGWLGALAYTLQLYFDFSGYSDMAIGVARMLGVVLPANFDSPYKATSMIDFWRRWHITLSHFLRDYLYIPLGGSRKGEWRRGINLMVTMLIGGLWHGAGWNFLIWGGLHGLYLTINHGWRSIQRRLRPEARSGGIGGWLITFLAVVIGWVFFRAPSTAIALAMLRSMAGLNGISLPETWATALGFLQPLGVRFEELLPHLSIEIAGIADTETLEPITPLLTVAVLLLLVWLTPNSQQWLGRYRPTLECFTAEFWTAASTESSEFDASLSGRSIANQSTVNQLTINQPATNQPIGWHWQWHPSPIWAVGMAILTLLALLNLARVSEFLYFEF